MTSIHRYSVRLAAVLVLAVMACGGAAAQDEMQLETDDQKVLYALGSILADQLGQFRLSEEELSYVLAGMEDKVMKRDARADANALRAQIQVFAQARIATWQEEEKAAAAKFLEKTAAEEGVERLDSGLLYSELTAGDGASPAATDTVTVHYHGTLRDGTVFDSSRDRGQPATFALNRVIPCWTEGLQKMKPGGKSRLVCPASIAYGDRGSPPKIGPGAALVFEVELIEIKAAEPAPPSDIQ